MAKLGRKTRVPQEEGSASRNFSASGIIWDSMNIMAPTSFFTFERSNDPQKRENKQKKMAEKAIRNAQRQTTKRVRSGRPY